MDKWREVLFKVGKYKQLQADIKDIDIELENINDKSFLLSNDDKLGIKKDIKCNSDSNVEKIVAEKDKLNFERNEKLRQLARINNALTVLSDNEREVINTVFIEGKKYHVCQQRVNLSYPRLKQLERSAAKKMEKYIK